jgi:hypothetical protein
MLNYISYQGVINTKELYSLAMEIQKTKNLQTELWRHKDIEFYMYGHVDTIDLNELSFFKPKFNPYSIEFNIDQHILKSDLDRISEIGSLYTTETISVLNDLKKALNGGFKNKLEIPTSESTEKRDVEIKLGL